MLLHIDGFEYDPQIFNQNAQPALGFGKATYLNSLVTRINGRRSSSKGFALPAFLNSNQGSYSKTMDGTETEIIMGCAIRVNPDLNFVKTCLFHLADDQNSTFSTIEVDSLGIISMNVSGIELGKSLKPINFNVWNFIELRVRSSTTVGQAELKVNNQSYFNLTNVNTKRSGGNYKQFGIGAPRTVRSQSSIDVDDFYAINVAGGVNNAFLGDSRVDVLRATGAGANTAFTATPPTGNWDRVNEVDTDLNDFVTSTAIAQRDTYVYSDLPSLNTPTIFGVQIVSVAAKSDAGNASIKNIVKSGANVYPGTTEPLSVDAMVYSTLFDRNPDGTIVWTEASVNSAEFGVESA